MVEDIPPSRVNIRLELSSKGAQRQHELPLKLFCLGPYTQSDKPLKQRDRYRIDKNNFQQIFAKLKPEIKVTVNKCQHNLCFKTLNDFSPSKLGQQIPECRDLIAMRNLLKDLRHLALDNIDFRQHMLKIIRDPQAFTQLHQELKKTIRLHKAGCDG